MKTETLILKIDPALAERLAEHKRQTLVPTSAFVRFAIESALRVPLFDARGEGTVPRWQGNLSEPVQQVNVPLLAPEKGAE